MRFHFPSEVVEEQEGFRVGGGEEGRRGGEEGRRGGEEGVREWEEGRRGGDEGVREGEGVVMAESLASDETLQLYDQVSSPTETPIYLTLLPSPAPLSFATHTGTTAASQLARADCHVR